MKTTPSARDGDGGQGGQAGDPRRPRNRADTGLRPRPRPADPDLAPEAAHAAKHRGGYRRPLARLADSAAAAAAEVLALAAPVDCVCCGAEDLTLCGGCERHVRQLMRQPFRAESQAPALMDVDGSVLLPVVAAGTYRGELAQAVLSFKRHGQRQLAGVLSIGLARAIKAAAGQTPGLLLVPVPTSSRAYRKRGFSPVHVLLDRMGRTRSSREYCRVSTAVALRKTGQRARVAGAGYGVPGIGAGPGGQKGLGRKDRAQRVRGSMRVRRGPFCPDLTGQPCIIVDDVLTTGATLAEAARALREAGALVQGAVVLAATRPPVTHNLGVAGRQLAEESPSNKI